MIFVRSSWSRSMRLAILTAGVLQAAVAVETAVTPPITPPATVPATSPAEHEFDTLLAELTPPGSSAQIIAITQVFESSSVVQKERLMIGLGTAKMTNALPFVVDHAADENPVVALAALRACLDLGPSTIEEFNRVHAALNSADPRVQTRAAMMLAHLEDESSVRALTHRLGTVTEPEATATLAFLHDLSGKDLGDTAQPWQTWLDAEIEAADANLPLVQQRLASKDPEIVIAALKESSLLRIRRSLLVPSILPLLGNAHADVAQMADMSLKALGGPVAKGALKMWQKDHPVTQTTNQATPVAAMAPPEAPTIAAHFHLSSGVQDFLVISGLVFIFCVVFVILGRPTKKALMTIDQATGGHMTRRLVMAKAKGQAAIRNTTTFLKRGGKSSKPSRTQPEPPALERKTPRPEAGVLSK